MKTFFKYLYIGVASIFIFFMVTALIYAFNEIKNISYINFTIYFLYFMLKLFMMGASITFVGMSMYWLCKQGYKKFFGEKNEL